MIFSSKNNDTNQDALSTCYCRFNFADTYLYDAIADSRKHPSVFASQFGFLLLFLFPLISGFGLGGIQKLDLLSVQEQRVGSTGPVLKTGYQLIALYTA